jgi:chromosome partitioning protein
MTQIISFSNLKGGVGKTTSTINVGAALHRMGKTVLLVDLDPQSNLTQSLGIVDAPINIYRALVGQCEMLPHEIKKGFYIIPSSLDLTVAESELNAEPGSDFFLKGLIRKLQKTHNYDYILIDCPPSIGFLTINAFALSDQVFIPLQAQFLATQGLSKLLEVISKVQLRLNENLLIGGIFLTQFDARTVLNRKVSETIGYHLKDDIMDTKIRSNIALAEAPSVGMDIFSYNEKSNGAEDYESLTKEIIKRNKKK